MAGGGFPAHADRETKARRDSLRSRRANGQGRRLRALACHASQFADFKAVEKRVRERSGEIGKDKGYAHAEGFDHIVMP